MQEKAKWMFILLSLCKPTPLIVIITSATNCRIVISALQEYLLSIFVLHRQIVSVRKSIGHHLTFVIALLLRFTVITKA